MRVMIIPEDKFISVNGRGLNFDFEATPNIHAIQWYDDYGVVELKVGGSRPATLAEVQPFVDLWEAEKAVVDAPPPPPTQAQIIAALLKKIDSDVDRIYQSAVGNRTAEYMQAEADALAYKNAGYTGTVPASLQSWATATGNALQWATNNTLETATAWRGAQAAIRDNRLKCKEAARATTTAEQAATVEAQWTGFVAAITAQLGV